MATNPFEILAAGFSTVNKVEENSVLNGSGFRLLLSLYRKACEMSEDEETVSLSSSVDSIFINLLHDAIDQDEEYEKFALVPDSKLMELVRGFCEYDVKQTYYPKVREEMKIKLSKIV